MIRVPLLIIFSVLLGTLSLGAASMPFITSSLYPGYTPQTQRTDPRLDGIWAEEYLGEIAIVSLPDGGYHVRPNGGGMLSLLDLTFKARLFQIQHAMFVDLVPSGATFKDLYPADSHCFAVVRIDGRSLFLTLLDPAFVAAQVRGYPRKLNFVEYRNGLLLAEPTAVLEKVLMEIAVKPGSAYDTYHFIRR